MQKKLEKKNISSLKFYRSPFEREKKYHEIEIKWETTTLIVFPFLQRNHSLQFHKRNTHADKNKLDFQCEKCGFATYAKRYLQSHLRKVHRGNEKYKHICEHCGEGFLYPFDLNKHHVIISLLKNPLMVKGHFNP